MRPAEIIARLRSIKAQIEESKVIRDYHLAKMREAEREETRLRAEYSEVWRDLDKFIGEPSFDEHSLKSGWYEQREEWAKQKPS